MRGLKRISRLASRRPRLKTPRVPRLGRRARGTVPLPAVGQHPAGGPLPAGQDPAAAAAAAAPSFRDRGRLRRRLRYLRRARELGFRDLGGLLFDLRRFGRERPDLVDGKLAALAEVDRELRTLETVLDDKRHIHELREPGISACARCGALHPSEAHFCPHCGLPLDGPRAMGEIGGAIAAPPQPPPPPAPAPAASPSAQTAVHQPAAPAAGPKAGDAPAPAAGPKAGDAEADPAGDANADRPGGSPPGTSADSWLPRGS